MRARKRATATARATRGQPWDEGVEAGTFYPSINKTVGEYYTERKNITPGRSSRAERSAALAAWPTVRAAVLPFIVRGQGSRCMSAFALDLEAYFTRIGYTGPREPTLEVLTAIHQHHSRAIPFENLDVLLGRGINIEPAAIERKLVHDRRGGYCFEQNSLLRLVLTTLGFQVTPLIGRVRWQVPAETATGLTHVFLRVDFGERAYLADVGFGSRSLYAPLALEYDIEQTGSFELRRLIRRGSLVVHQTPWETGWADVYQFALDPAPQVDFEIGNWFTSTHPQSRFKQNLVASIAGEGCRRVLLNREFITRRPDGDVEKHMIESPDELLAVLAEHFGLHFPAGTRFGPPGSPWPS